MEPSLATAACLICFEMTGKQVFVASETAVKFFSSCNAYLHSTITSETLKDIQLNNEVSLCQCCFDSATKLTQLSEQLTTIQKDISDLTVEFSMTVFHRRSQVYTLSQMDMSNQSFNNSSIIEFNESCLPPNLFSTKNSPHDKSKDDLIISSLQTRSDLVNVKTESSDFQFDDFFESSQPLTENDGAEIQRVPNEENFNQHCRQSTFEKNKNASSSETKIVRVAGGHESKKCPDRKKIMRTKISDCSKSDKIPVVRLMGFSLTRKCQANILGQNAKNSKSCNPSIKNFSEACFPPNLLPAIIISHEKRNDDIIINNMQARTDTTNMKCLTNDVQFDEFSEIGQPLFGNDDAETQISTNAENLDKNNRQPSNEKNESTSSVSEVKNVADGNDAKYCADGDNTIMQFSTSGASVKSVIIPDIRFEKIKVDGPEIDGSAVNSFNANDEPSQNVSDSVLLCEQKLAHGRQQKIHKKTHSGKNPFNCSFCKKCFPTQSALQIHRKVHAEKKSFKCLLCHEVFTHQRDMTNHKLTQSKGKPFKCSVFQKEFEWLQGQFPSRTNLMDRRRNTLNKNHKM